MKIFITIIISILFGGLFTLKYPILALGLGAIPLLYTVLSRKMEYGLYLMSAIIPFQYFFTNYYLGFLPRTFVWIDEIILVILLVITLANLIIRRTGPSFSSVDTAVLCFFILAIISSIFNLVNPMVALSGMRSFLQFYLLYFIIKNNSFTKKFYKNLITLLFFSFLIQIPVAIYQFISWRPIYYNKLTHAFVNQWDLSFYDAVVGTFGKGAANNFGYLLIMIIFILLGIYFLLKTKKYLWFALSLILPLILTQARGAYFLFVGIFLLTFRDAIIKHLQRFFFIIIVLIIFSSGLFYSYFKYSGYDFNKFFGIKNLYEQQWDISPSSSGRLAGIKVAHDVITEGSYNLLIGVGPGMFSSTAGVALSSPLYIATVKKLNSHRCITENDIVPLMTEYGYVGLLLFILVVLMMLKENYVIYFKTKSKYLKAITYGGRGLLMTFLFAGIFVQVYEVQYISFYVWLYLGFMQNLFEGDNQCC